MVIKKTHIAEAIKALSKKEQRQLIISCDKDWHYNVKIWATTNKLTIRDLVIKAINDYMEKQKK